MEIHGNLVVKTAVRDDDDRFEVTFKMIYIYIYEEQGI